MSTAASPAPSEGESKRGEVAYRFCQDWLVRPSHLDLRNSLTRFAVQISCIPKRIERLHNSYSYAKRATRPKCSITLAPTAINSVLPSRKLPVSRQMLRMIQLCVMTLLCCPASVPCAEIKSGAEDVENQHWRSQMCLIYQVKRGTAGINLDDLLLWINFIETSTNWFITSQLPRAIKKCLRCKENDAVYFQSQQRAADTGMVRLHCCVWDYASDISQKLYYVCTSCNYVHTVV